MTPEESQLSPRLRAMSLEESWLSLRLMALSLGESRHSLGVTKDELECLQGIWDRSFIPRSPQNDSSPPYRKLENGRKWIKAPSMCAIYRLPLQGRSRRGFRGCTWTHGFLESTNRNPSEPTRKLIKQILWTHGLRFLTTPLKKLLEQ